MLDVGAGTGRVALDLAAAGHEVTALDIDAELLDALRAARARPAGSRVETVGADARDFALPGAAFALIAVPMQTIQLLPGAAARAGFFATARRALAPGGRVALALADALGALRGARPAPAARRRRGGRRRFVSQPLAIRSRRGDTWRSSACARSSRPTARAATDDDLIELDRVDAGGLAARGGRRGLHRRGAASTSPRPPTTSARGGDPPWLS